MTNTNSILGVYLSDSLDLDAIYGNALRDEASDVVLRHPHEIDNPEDVRFAICWLPNDKAFEREFTTLEQNAAKAHWAPLTMRAPASRKVAVLGHGTMGRAVVKAVAALGFSVHVACRSEPQAPVEGVTYLTGDGAVMAAADGADYLINVLPLTATTENVLNKALFAKLAKDAWLVQIGRGEHLVEDDLLLALEHGHLGGASLDVFRAEPLPADHPFWQHECLRITPHIASDSLPEVVAGQVVDTARALRDGQPLAMGVDRARGY